MALEVTEIVELAAEHVLEGRMASSASLCLDDAIANLTRGNVEGARKRAIDSLRYSVGICHPDYARATAEPGFSGAAFNRRGQLVRVFVPGSEG